jgi:hypothetical protein
MPHTFRELYKEKQIEYGVQIELAKEQQIVCTQQ